MIGALEKGSITETEVEDLGTGQYIICTIGDNYVLACKGQQQNTRRPRDRNISCWDRRLVHNER